MAGIYRRSLARIGRKESEISEIRTTPADELSSWLGDDVCTNCGASTPHGKLFCSEACKLADAKEVAQASMIESLASPIQSRTSLPGSTTASSSATPAPLPLACSPRCRHRCAPPTSHRLPSPPTRARYRSLEAATASPPLPPTRLAPTTPVRPRSEAAPSPLSRPSPSPTPARAHSQAPIPRRHPRLRSHRGRVERPRCARLPAPSLCQHRQRRDAPQELQVVRIASRASPHHRRLPHTQVASLVRSSAQQHKLAWKLVHLARHHRHHHGHCHQPRPPQPHRRATSISARRPGHLDSQGCQGCPRPGIPVGPRLEQPVGAR